MLGKTSLKKWAKSNLNHLNPKNNEKGHVYLFLDEFTNYNDTGVGEKAIKLLTKLGYRVEIPEHSLSGRTFLSKGFLRSARKIAIKNVELLGDLSTEKNPLIGIEPSAILGFRDEYPELVGKNLRPKAEKLGRNALMIDEFLDREMQSGKITKEQFIKDAQKIKLHGHCQQKSIASTGPTKAVLSFPENYSVEEIPSGCCGMAGSFGYEKEHYELSMKVGELVLFPEIRKTEREVIIAAPGTSCRHQVKDGTGRDAKHPVEILYEALL